MNHIILDLEMNTTPKESGAKNEIIEIGAVKLDENLKEISRFSTYVCPEHGEITSIINELTGISQSDVDDAPKFSEAMDMFFKWVGNDKSTFYSWSNCDKKQFEHEMELKSYVDPRMNKMLKSWVDIQVEYDKLLGTGHTVALNNALKSANIELIGKPHTALGDAINTAELFKVMKDDKEVEARLGNLIEMFKHKELANSILDLFPEMAAYIAKDDEETEKNE